MSHIQWITNGRDPQWGWMQAHPDTMGVFLRWGWTKVELLDSRGWFYLCDWLSDLVTCWLTSDLRCQALLRLSCHPNCLLSSAVMLLLLLPLKCTSAPQSARGQDSEIIHVLKDIQEHPYVAGQLDLLACHSSASPTGAAEGLFIALPKSDRGRTAAIHSYTQ